MRDTEPGETVVLDDLASTPDGRGVADTPDHGCDTDVGHDDCATLGLGEKDRVGYIAEYYQHHHTF